jgi:hypothetical protein
MVLCFSALFENLCTVLRDMDYLASETIVFLASKSSFSPVYVIWAATRLILFHVHPIQGPLYDLRDVCYHASDTIVAVQPIQEPLYGPPDVYHASDTTVIDIKIRILSTSILIWAFARLLPLS